MKKIKILDKGFPATGFGYLESRTEYNLPDHFADYCVKKMRSAVYCEAEILPKVSSGVEMPKVKQPRKTVKK